MTLTCPRFLGSREEGTSVAEVCRKAGISEATYYVWRKKFGGLMPSEVKRLKQLEEENGKLKRIVADLALDKEMLQDVHQAKVIGIGESSQAPRAGGMEPSKPPNVQKQHYGGNTHE